MDGLDFKQKYQLKFGQLDQGIIAENLQLDQFLIRLPDELMDNYEQGIFLFDGSIYTLGDKGVHRFDHITWDQSLALFKDIVDGDWSKQFARAIDIYIGKIKGFKNVPEEEEIRLAMLKAELKIIVQNIV